MTNGFSVAIIHHLDQPRIFQDSYILSHLCKYWERQGIKVHHLYGTDEFVEADVAFLHVDLSVVPESYASFAEHYPVSINTSVLDIRKRAYSKIALSRTDNYKGPVIVKTNFNAGGNPERRIKAFKKPYIYRKTLNLYRNLLKNLIFLDPSDRIYSSNDYIVYSNIGEMPEKIFNNSKLIVEKFVPERREAGYIHRRYYFLGEKEMNFVWYGNKAICAHDEDGIPMVTEPVPSELRSFRYKFGIDYGKFDYVLDSKGNVIVLDVNKTPWATSGDPRYTPWLEKLCENLHAGIYSLLTGNSDTYSKINQSNK